MPTKSQDLSIKPAIAATANLFQSTTGYDMDVAPLWDLPEYVNLRYDISSSVEGSVLPPTLHFSSFALRSQNGSGERIGIFDELALHWIHNGLRPDSITHSENRTNYLDKSGEVVSDKKVNISYDQRLDLSATWIMMSRLFGGSIHPSKLRLQLTPRADIGLRAAVDGTIATLAAGNITNGAFTLDAQFKKLEHKEMLRVSSMYNKQRNTVILEPQRIAINKNDAYTVGTEFTHTLTALHNPVAFVAIAIKYNNVAGTDANAVGGNDALMGPYMDLGDDGIVDIRDSRNISVLSDTKNYNVQTIRRRMDTFMPNSFLKDRNVYVIPFCSDPMMAFWKPSKGVDGFLPGTTDHYQLVLKPGAAGVNSTLTVAYAAPPIDGYCEFSYGNHTTKPLAFDASVAVVNHELRKLLSRYGLKATTSAAANADFVVTFHGCPKHIDGRNLSFKQINGQAAAGAVTGTTCVWDQGKEGTSVNHADAASTTIETYWFSPTVVTQKEQVVTSRRLSNNEVSRLG